MDSVLKITTGVRTIPIERDGVNVGSISFNPEDLAFMDKVYALYAELRAKDSEWERRAKEIDAQTTLDENNMPINGAERSVYLLEVCGYMRGRIDSVFGAGTSEIVFGDTMRFEVIEQFLYAVEPHIKQARESKTAQYTTPESARRNKVTRKRSK